MSLTKIVAFDRVLFGAAVAGGARQTYTDADLAKKCQEAYCRGVDATREAADQQMVELRHDIEQLSDGVLKQISSIESILLADIQKALPLLALDIGRRLLSGYEPSAEVVARLCQEALEQLYPEREGLELSLSSRDADLLNSLDPDWLMRYPNLRVRSDPALIPGDCQVRSRFGLTDARMDTKLAALGHHLMSI